MFCSKCGNELCKEDLFCSKCGNKVIYNIEQEKKNSNEAALSLAVQQLKQGDEQGFNTIYSHTYKYVYNRAKYMLKDEHEAQDLTHDVYVALYKGIDSLKDDNSIYGWLKTVILRQGLRFIKKKNKYTLISDDGEFLFDNLIDDEARIEESYANSADVQAIKECIGLLSEEQRLIVLAYYYDNMSIKEIAEAMELSEGTVKSRLYLARKHLMKTFEEQEKKQGYKFFAAGIPAFMFALDDMIKANVDFSKEVILEHYTNVCNEVGIGLEDMIIRLAEDLSVDPTTDVINDIDNVAESINGTSGFIGKLTTIGTKKIALVTAGVLVAGGIAGGVALWNNSRETENTDLSSLSSSLEQEVFDQEAFMNQAKECVLYLNSCEEFLYGAEIETEAGEWKVYNITDEGEFYSEYNDDTLSYIKVVNFDTLNEVKNHARNYLSDKMIETLQYFDDIPFVEYDDGLYRYLDTSFNYWYDEDSIVYIGERNGKHYIDVDYYDWDEYSHTQKFEFEEHNGRWVLNAIDDYGFINDEDEALEYLSKNIEIEEGCALMVDNYDNGTYLIRYFENNHDTHIVTRAWYEVDEFDGAINKQ